MGIKPKMERYAGLQDKINDYIHKNINDIIDDYLEDIIVNLEERGYKVIENKNKDFEE